jgi:hypothetical protein
MVHVQNLIVSSKTQKANNIQLVYFQIINTIFQ